jgi:HEAT repeat protein
VSDDPNLENGSDPRPTEELIRFALAEEDEDAAWEIKRIIFNKSSREVFDAACQLLLSEKVQERQLGTDILGRLGGMDRPFREETLPVLLDRLLKETDELALSSVCFALGHLLDDPRAVPYLME